MRFAKRIVLCACVFTLMTACGRIEKGERMTTESTETNQLDPGIASYRTMENYIARIKKNGTNAQIEVFKGLSHGFGLGQGTVAEGWIDHAVAFWEENMGDRK